MTKDPRYKPIAVRSPRGARTTEIDWADGHRGVYPHAVLRGYCPCAGCQGHSGEIHFVETEDVQQELDAIEPVGGYALALSGSTATRAVSTASRSCASSAGARPAPPGQGGPP